MKDTLHKQLFDLGSLAQCLPESCAHAIPLLGVGSARDQLLCRLLGRCAD